jgi:NitT/TauT family transport system permease protein
MSDDPSNLSAEQVERLEAPVRRDRVFRIVSYFSPILIFWELASRGGLVDRRFFPPPSGIAETAWKMTASGEIFMHIWATFQRVAIGYMLGAIPGLLFGLALGSSVRLNRVLGPIFAALYPVPKIAILPLILLLFGIGELSKWIVVAIGVFFLMFYNTLSGVRQTPRIYLDVARNAGASRLQTFARISIPAALPSNLHRPAAFRRHGLHRDCHDRVSRRPLRRRLFHLDVVAGICGRAHVRRCGRHFADGLPDAAGAGTDRASCSAMGETLEPAVAR